MVSKPNLSKIASLFASNEDFSLTEEQYFNTTGASLPKSTYYLLKDSAISKLAQKFGYTIEVKSRTICLKKTS